MILSLPTHERPRERCLEMGPQCLSLRECLALILGSGPSPIGCLGLAWKILNQPGNLSPKEQDHAFFTAMEISGRAYLNNCSGLGPAGQAKILAAFEIGRRYAVYRCHQQQTHDKSSYPLLIKQALKKISYQERMQPQEWIGFVPLHRTGKLGDFCLVERGARTHVNCDPAELFARILALRPRGIFLFHNHPSGIPTPSTQDLDLTQKVEELSQVFGLQFYGHWIVTPETEFWIPSDLVRIS